MATENVINKPAVIAAAGDYDELSMRLAMLQANLSIISGDGFDAFKLASSDIQQHYLWGCSILAEECRGIVIRNLGVLE